MRASVHACFRTRASCHDSSRMPPPSTHRRPACNGLRSQELEPQLTSTPSPGLLFDYYGFPAAAYQLTYPAPGDPGLAQRAADLLRCETR